MTPRYYKIHPLSILLSDFVTANVAWILRTHKSSTCKYCTNKFLNTDCVALKQLKHTVGEFPGTIRSAFHSKLMHLLQIYLNADGETAEPKRFELLYLITWLFEHLDLKIKYDSISDIEDYTFVQKYGEYIMGLEFYRHSYTSSTKQARKKDYKPNKFILRYNEDCLMSSLQQCSNLLVADFRAINISDDIMDCIGKNCCFIREFFVYVERVTPSFTHLGYQKLLFEDCKALKKNKCCDTLRILNISFSSWSESKNAFFPSELDRSETLKLILANVRNLRTLGSGESICECCGISTAGIVYGYYGDYYCYPMEQIVSAVDFPTNIETGYVSTLTDDMVINIKKIFPKLNSLTANSVQNCETLEHLKSFDHLEILVVEISSILYKGLLYSEWTSLKHLTLKSNKESLSSVVIDISEFAMKFPNLEHLSFQFPKVTWDKQYCFRTLKGLNWDTYGPTLGAWNLDWFPSFSRTIEEIKLQRSGLNQNESLSIFLTNDYPKLEVLFISPFAFDAILVLDIINNCPELHSLGYIEGDRSDIVEFEQYLKQNNIDCQLKNSRFYDYFHY